MNRIIFRSCLVPILCLFLPTSHYGCELIVDSIPEHYILIDSLGIDFDKELKIFQTCKEELKDPYWKWWDRNALYQSYFFSAMNLFLPIHEIKSIWLSRYENDPHYTCREVDGQLKRIAAQPLTHSIPSPSDCFVLREKSFFEMHCKETYKSIDSTLALKFRAAESAISLTVANRNLIEQTVKNLGIYPGRSVIGIDNEAFPWFIIIKGDVNFIKSFLPYIERAVKEKNLDPQYYAMTIDKIAVLENKPQIYGTEYTMEGGQKKYYPIIDIDNINKRRRSNGLGIFNKSYNIYDTVILGKKYR